MSLFNNKDIEIVDGDVLRRLLKYANHSNDCITNSTQDIQNLKLTQNELEIELSKVKQVSSKQELDDVKSEIKTIKTTTVIMTILLFLQLVMFGLFFAYLLYPDFFARIIT